MKRIQTILSVAVGNFTQTHPEARVELFDLSTEEMLAGLENDKLDVALSVGQPQRGTRGLKWTPLLRAPWQLVVNRNHRLARRSQVTPAEVAREPLLVFSQRDYPEYWDIITGWLRDHRQRPRIAGEYDGLESLMAAVESGLGVALLTSRTAHRVPKRVRLKKLSAPPEPVCIAVGHRETRADDTALAVDDGWTRGTNVAGRSACGAEGVDAESANGSRKLSQKHQAAAARTPCRRSPACRVRSGWRSASPRATRAWSSGCPPR